MLFDKKIIDEMGKRFPLVVTPVLLMGLFLVMFFVVRVGIYNLNEERLKGKVSVEMGQTLQVIEGKSEKYQLLLKAARGLIEADEEITRAEWKTYFESLDPKNSYPALVALGVVRQVKDKEIKGFESRVREDKTVVPEGYPDFIIKMASGGANLDEQYVLDFAEPFLENEEAFGFDLRSEPVRRSALELARDTNGFVITAPLKLIIEKKERNSVLMVLPIYDGGVQVQTLEDRRAKLIGFVVAAVNAPELFSSVLLATNLTSLDGMTIRDVTAEPVDLVDFISSDGSLDKEIEKEMLEVQKSRVEFGSRIWEVVFKSNRKVEIVGVELFLPYILLFLGIVIVLVESRRVIQLLRKTGKLLDSEKIRLSSIVKGSNLGTWEWNVQTGEVKFNERWAEIIGYKLEELQPVSIKTWEKFLNPEDSAASEEALERHFKGEKDFYEVEVRMLHKDGSWVWVQDRGKVFEWTEDKNPLLMFGSHQDISDRKNLEEKLQDTVKSLGDMNRYMIGRELKMVELKKQLSDNK